MARFNSVFETTGVVESVYGLSLPHDYMEKTNQILQSSVTNSPQGTMMKSTTSLP